jgi:hypothetical protein
MARLLCDHVDVSFLQQFSFFIAKKGFNPLVDCKSISGLDLSLWSFENVTVQSCTTITNATEAVASATVFEIAEVFDAIYTLLNDKLTTAIQDFSPLEALLSTSLNTTSVVNASSDVQRAIVTFAASVSDVLPLQYISVSLSTLLENDQPSSVKRRRRQAM